MNRLALIAALLWLPVATRAATNYLAVVRGYADTLIEQGRDRYGAMPSPLFAVTLDRQTLSLPDAKVPGPPGIRDSDRVVTGANPMHDENLYQVLYALTKITGDQKYAQAADAALGWFFAHCQSPATGLLAWGEHIGWDFRTEAATTHRDDHEFYRPWVFWDKSFALAPAACRKFATGLWEHQMYDHTECRFSRHGGFAHHNPGQGTEFPRHGGFYIATWAAAYAHTKDEEYLTAIAALTDSFEKRRQANHGALVAATDYQDLLWSLSTLALAIDLAESAPKVPAALARKMRALAGAVDATFLKLKHGLTEGGRGFLVAGRCSTLQPASKAPFSDRWALRYGAVTDAACAMNCLVRYRQTQNAGYRQLVVATAQRYLKSEPDPAQPLYPGALGDVIRVLLGAYDETQEPVYRERARHFAGQAVKLFCDGSPLPRASTQNTHYEAVTRADTLMQALLELWATDQTPRVATGLQWIER